jgi:hypothetical protein
MQQINLNTGGTNVTFLTPSAAPVSGQIFVVRITQPGSGTLGTIVSWFSGIKWPSGNIPTLTATFAKTDVFVFACTSTNNYDGFVVGQNL